MHTTNTIHMSDITNIHTYTNIQTKQRRSYMFSSTEQSGRVSGETIGLHFFPEGDGEALEQMLDSCGRRSTKSLTNQFANPGNQGNGVQGRIQEIEFGGGPGSFCRGGCRIGGSRAQTALKIFSHRVHCTCRFHVLV